MLEIIRIALKFGFAMICGGLVGIVVVCVFLGIGIPVIIGLMHFLMWLGVK